ncbi:MAG: 2-hydroxychromene-2-carboxylate isomerase [Acidobacteriota bacterium]|jgi:2-hydroxychromene-2-carboxylate isomerase
MPVQQPIRLYFDVVSPYTWLALLEAGAFARRNGIVWDPRPVVYGALLGAWDLVGPVEVPVKRDYTFRDVARCARLLGRRLVGPPAHPFRSVAALRAFLLFRPAVPPLPLAVALADAAWGEGRDLTDPSVLAWVVERAGADPAGLEARLRDDGVKRELHEATEEARARGVFGVPTFEHEGRLFWGHDRLPHLEAVLQGRLPVSPPEVEEVLRRPAGARRVSERSCRGRRRPS